MDGLQIFCTVFVTIVSWADFAGADHEHMIKKVEPIAVPLKFETKLQCTMNIEPDKYQWKFYPLPRQEAYNPKAAISLSKSNFVMLPHRQQSGLILEADNEETAGDYQCLAYYGASVVASVPWRITIAILNQFPKQKNADVTVTAGNTVNWRCEPPESNPEALIDYYKDDNYISQSTPVATKSLIIPNVNASHTGKYRCKATNILKDNRDSPTIFNLKVVNSGPRQPPTFVIALKKVYTVNRGESVFLECSAVGNPVPQVTWKKNVGEITKRRARMIEGGLFIENVSSSDDGTYTCSHKNSLATLAHQITLVYNEPPSIDCMYNSTDVKQGENLDLDCTVTGTPDPEISWFLNGFSVLNDSAIEAIGNTIYFRPVEKRHAGNLQIFARNVVNTIYHSISIKVIPLSTSIDVAVPTTRTRHKGSGSRKLSPKHTKMVPPSKPTVSRLNDETVVVRWSVPSNKGLPIQFFKVQYRELGPVNQHEHHRKASKWMTTNADIAPHIGSYEVNNLKPDHVYRFRIAAVYSNNDNKDSPNSEKFFLRRMDFDNRNILPIPLITHTETVNSTAVQIYWKYDPVPNVTVAGFHINYISASSAADYMKATVDGENTNSYVLSHLQPDTLYDIKLQSFTSKSASEFSSIMKAKTLAVVTTTIAPTVKDIPPQTSGATESAGISKLYIFIAAGALVGSSVIAVAVALLFYCRKWKHKKSANRSDRDKPGVDDRHIQADSNEYVVSSKAVPRANGCVGPPNRITITANPLADADNKNQNMIEMSCLSSQNNNCSATVQPSASGEDSTSKDKKNKNREKRLRKKNNTETNTSGENYV